MNTLKLTAQARGVYVIAPTPFTADNAIDFSSIDRLVDFYTQAGVNGCTVLGQLGEAPKLAEDEAIQVAKRFIQRALTPTIVGVSATGFEAMRMLAREAMEAGAAGVMIAPPNTLRTDDQIVSYYEQAVASIGEDVPFVIQDYPLTFTVVMSPSVIKRIVNNHASCQMLKHEDWPGLEKISTLKSWQLEGEMREISILCGNGGLFLDFEVERGANGAMTGYCFPDMLVDVVQLSTNGQRAKAHDLFDAHLPLMRYVQQPGVGLAVRKYILKRRGLLPSDAQRKPAIALSSTAKTEVEYLLARLSWHDPRAHLSS